MKISILSGNRIWAILFLSFSYPAVYSQIPDISYDRHYQFVVGNPVTPVVPVNTGGAIPPVAYGTTTTIAGSTRSFADGTGKDAKFNFPQGIAVDASGNIYVADRSNHRIRKILPDGTTSTIAGTGNAGFTNGTVPVAKFNQPANVVVSPNGDIYVTEISNHCIRKISSGQVTTLAGSGSAGFVDANGSSARFNIPFGISMNNTGDLFVADRYNHRIRKVTQSGEVSTFAGNGNINGINAQGINATFNHPVGVACSGNLIYVGDYNNNLIRAINEQQYVSTLAGCFCSGITDGEGLNAGFINPFGLSDGPDGDIFVADYNSNRIRRISPQGVVTTLAGSGVAGIADEIGELASFRTPADVAVDKDGNVYIADYGNHLIRKVISTGYTISPALPAGLIFDPATGKITGIPVIEAQNQIYTVTAYNRNGKSTASFQLEVLKNTGIKDNVEKSSFSIYPNPLKSNVLNINIPASPHEDVTIILYEISGKVLFSNTCRVVDHKVELKLDIKACNTLVFLEVVGYGVQKLILNNI